MADIYDRNKRSLIMSKVKRKNTKLEVMLRKALFQAGLRGYRIDSKLPGHPDIVYTRFKVAIFVDGCFWHGCPKCGSIPKSNTEFWINKINANKDRDIRVNKMLGENGWTVLRFWQHEISKELDRVLQTVRYFLNK